MTNINTNPINNHYTNVSDNPYKALTPYQEKDNEFFGGRDEDTEKLFQLVKYNSLTVIFGKSGIGKTSLLNAGLFPRLKKENFRPIRIRLNFSPDASSLKEQICSAIVSGLASNENDNSKIEIKSQIEDIPPHPLSTDETLWEYFRRVNHFETTKEGKKKIIPVLVFDQFEEIFTLGRYHKERDGIIDEFSWLIEEQIPPKIREQVINDEKIAKKLVYSKIQSYVKVIISLREDYLPHFVELKSRIHFFGQSLFRVVHLNGKQARDIISKPKNGFKDEKTISKIITTLSSNNIVKGIELPEEKFEIEPAFLSLLCHQMYEKGMFESVKPEELSLLIEEYYNSKIKEYPKKVAIFIESNLLTDAGFRTPRYLEKNHPLKEYLKQLEEERILRIFHEGHEEYVEIIHDFLVSIILEKRNRRLQKKANKYISFFTGIICILLLLTILAIHQCSRANKQANIAEINRLNAEASLELPNDNTKALRIAEIAIKKVPKGYEKLPLKVLSKIAYSSVKRPFYINITPLKRDDVIGDAVFSADGKRIITAHENGDVYICDLEGNTLRELKGHKERVSSIAFSPDEEFILSGSWDKTARLWSQTGEIQKEFKHEGPVTSVAFSPDGKRILTASYDNTARLWDLEGRLLQIFKCDGKVSSVKFSKDGKRIITVSWDNRIRTWNDRGELLNTFVHENTRFSSILASNGKFALIAESNNIIRLWDMKNKEPKTSIKYEGKLSMMKFSPTGNYILTGTENGSLKLFDLKGNQIAQFEKHGRKITAAAFSPDESYIFSSSDGESSILWNIKSNIVVNLEHDEEISTVKFSPDGSLIATVTDDGTARLWKTNGRLESVATFKHNRGRIIKALFSPKMDFILTASNNGLIKRWTIDGKVSQDIKNFGNRITDLIINADGSKIAILSGPTEVQIVTPEGEILPQKIKHDNIICQAMFSPKDKNRLLTVSCKDGLIHLWNLNGIPPISISQENIATARFSPDGSLLIVSTKTGQISIYNLSGKMLHSFGISLENNRELVSATLSPGNKKILTIFNEGPVLLWNLDGIHPTDFTHEQHIYTAEFSHDGENILTASLDKKAKLWDISGNLFTTFNHDSAVFFAGFSPFDRQVVTICRDNTVRLWLAPSVILDWLRNSKIPELTENDKKELGLTNLER